MFRDKSTIILGAGASKEVNLPTGYELKSIISSLLHYEFDSLGTKQKGDEDLLSSMRIYAKDYVNTQDIYHSLLKAAEHISDALPQVNSIDTFLDMHRDNEFIQMVGKWSIVRSILSAEEKSHLFIPPGKNENPASRKLLESTWYNEFIKVLTARCTKENVKERLSRLNIIIFNYDRCFEHYLFYSLQNCYAFDSDEAAELIKGMDIYHPYGTVGNLPWYERENSIEFGGSVHPGLLPELAHLIKTFTEGTDPDSSQIESIRQAILESSIVVFLGFSYGKENIDLIETGSQHPERNAVQYFGTAKGLSDFDCSSKSSDLVRIADALHKKIILDNQASCVGLFQKYSTALSLN